MSISSFWTPAIALLAAFTAAIIARSVKISEFRQAYINELRKEIADYVGKAEQWHRAYDEINGIDARLPKREIRSRTELFTLANETKVILWRIIMRFNPRPNPYKEQEDRFLQSLADLIDTSKIPKNSEAAWDRLALQAVEQAQEILKREWEVTKTLIPKRLSMGCSAIYNKLKSIHYKAVFSKLASRNVDRGG